MSMTCSHSRGPNCTISPCGSVVVRHAEGEGINPKDALGVAKPQLDLVPPAALLYLSKVMALGAAKYGKYNWRQKKVRYSIYVAAAMRHLLTALDGEELDPESGQPHVAHAAACMAILLDAKATGNLVDDRPTPGVAGKLIAELTEPKVYTGRAETYIPAETLSAPLSLSAPRPVAERYPGQLANVCAGTPGEHLEKISRALREASQLTDEPFECATGAADVGSEARCDCGICGRPH